MMSSPLWRIAWRRRGALAAALALVVVMAGTALAASRGAPWRLGYLETLTGYVTGISGSHTYDLLRILNGSTASTARAIRAEAKSPSAGALYVRNSGGGPAANFVANAGKAAFTVNTGTKIANLNADRLDGLDSTQLLDGVRVRHTRAVAWPTGDQGVEYQWGSDISLTHPAGQVLTALAGTGTADTSNCTTADQPVGEAAVNVYVDGRKAATASVAIVDASQYGDGIRFYLDDLGKTFPAPPFDTAILHTVLVKVVDYCDAGDWTFRSLDLDFVFVG